MIIQDANIIAFAIDSNDHERMDQVKAEFKLLMAEPLLQGAIILILANKQDFPNALLPMDIVQLLEIESYKNKWACFGTVALTRTGVQEAFDWVISQLG
jgi:ADP-ribosylation factor-like protein 1